MTFDHGPWAPLSVDEVRCLLDGARFPWWFTGAIALELHTGRSWRGHADTDVGIRRVDAPALHDHLRHLPSYVAAAGSLRRWGGESLDESASESNVWVKAADGAHWVLDVVVGSGDDSGWVYRRDPSVRRSWPDAVLRTRDGLAYLAPELQLLFKSGSPRAKDEEDLLQCVQLIERERVLALEELLPAEHPWRAQVRAALARAPEA